MVAILGVKISGKKITREVPYKIGNHDFPESIKFHPETGKRLWDSYVSTIWEDKEGDYDPPKKYNLETVVDAEDGYGSEDIRKCNVFIGRSPFLVNDKVIAQIKSNLKDLLGDLYDESEFGMHST